MKQLKINKQITNRESQSLDKYLSEIGKVGLISVDEEVALAKRIREGDQEALEKLTKANLAFCGVCSEAISKSGLVAERSDKRRELGSYQGSGAF